MQNLGYRKLFSLSSWLSSLLNLPLLNIRIKPLYLGTPPICCAFLAVVDSVTLSFIHGNGTTSIEYINPVNVEVTI